ncbi:peptidase M61 [Sphingomonas sp. SM33]|uniref:Peptidase M61 n=1 Tax=Sphingomonas telluris TaxID=2907998 RepID=A0ABS9VP48_9SPHN|nr:peptidase M61 [Sphingomonas telluris]MCH8616755.1 peptidase M61 [Sphingomonas telluris]
MRAVALVCFALASAASAQTIPSLNSQPPAPTDKTAPIPAARDVPFPGTLQLTVDATDVTRGIFRIRERVPVTAAGDLVLLYPKWIPGGHTPRGDIAKVAGFKFSANGQPLEWKRDTIDVAAFHVNVPAGVTVVDVEFQYLTPTAANQGRIVATPDLASIQWISNSLYPAGYYVRQIPVQASVIVPTGWKVATALRPSAQLGNRIDYPVTNYEILLDSPLIAGAHYRQIPLSDDVFLDVVADTEAELAAKPEQIAAHKRLVEQAIKLFGAEHYDHYNFLLTISDYLGGIGLEHHRSSEDGVNRGYFTDWENKLGDRDLLPHEYVHSWNGKYRRGADLWTPDYRTPMQDSLLWVYEGQTQFWGYVLAARSGMLSKEDTLGALASTAAYYGYVTPGRSWRPLVDTTNDPIISSRAPQAWRSWQRAEDYYSEGLLVWTDVDRILRQQSGGKKSIDDFARAFFGMRNRDYGELTYTFEDVVRTLNAVQPYGWDGYLQKRVLDVAAQPPLEGLTMGGYKLIFADEPTAWIKSAQKDGKNNDLSYSGGFVVGNDGKIASVVWDSAAFNAGMTVGSELLAVNGRKFDGDGLTAAIKAAKTSKQPVKLLLKSGEVYRTVDLDWHGGLRYPRLEKIGKAPRTLDALLAPRK